MGHGRARAARVLRTVSRGAAIALTSCALTLTAIVVLGGCARPSQEQRIVRALQLHAVDNGLSYLTPQGCRIERLLVGAPDVWLFYVDDHHSLYANRAGTLGVKAVRLNSTCQDIVRAGLGTLP